MSENQAILHRAEELGQSRPYTSEEAAALLRLALIVGFWAGGVAMIAGAGILLYDKWGWWPMFYTLSLPAGVLVGGGIVLIKGAHEQLDGLRSWREATTYVPPQPEQPQLPSPWRPPVPVRTREGTTMIDMNERPMLPDPQQARQITPPLVAEILRASIEQYDGQWSRRKLMRLRIAGQKVSRGLYEELTSALHQCGLLQQTRQGGFELPHDVESFEDLQKYLPSLGGMGGGPGRDGNGQDFQEVPGHPSRGAVTNLAERRRQRFLECDCSVRDYLERKEGNDG